MGIKYCERWRPRYYYSRRRVRASSSAAWGNEQHAMTYMRQSIPQLAWIKWDRDTGKRYEVEDMRVEEIDPETKWERREWEGRGDEDIKLKNKKKFLSVGCLDCTWSLTEVVREGHYLTLLG